MGAVDVLGVLSVAGLTVQADGERLLVTPADRITPELREAIRASKPMILSALRPAARWMLHFADTETLTVTLDPPEAHAQVLARYPDAVAAEPLPTPPPEELQSADAAMVAECVTDGLYADDEVSLIRAMQAADPMATCTLIETMHARIGRCYQCRHFSRPGLSDGYCGGRLDLPHAYGFMHFLPAGKGATCNDFKEAT
jgi:hypothetical protein